MREWLRRTDDTNWVTMIGNGCVGNASRHGLIAVAAVVLFGFSVVPAYSLTLGLPDNSTFTIFLDTDDADTAPNFTGTLTTGLGVVTGLNLTMGITTFNFTAPADATDDFVAQIPELFVIFDPAPGGTAPGLALFGPLAPAPFAGGFLAGWFTDPATRVICGDVEDCRWSVPEPSTAFLLLAGLGALGFRLRPLRDRDNRFN